MKNRKEFMQVQVGGFILVGILLVILAVMVLGTRTGFLKQQYHLHCYFDDITGLAVGSQIKLAGLNAGIVDGITFVNHKSAPASDFDDNKSLNVDSGGNTIKDTGVKVRVSMKIDRRYQDLIRSDSVASIVGQGLLGDGVVFLSVGSEDQHILQNGQEVTQIRNPLTFYHLQRKGEIIVGDARKLVRNLSDLLDEIQHGSGFVHQLIYDKKTGEIPAKVGRVIDHLDTTTAHLASISDKVDDGQGTIGKLVNDPGVYNDLKTLLGKANRNKLVRSVIRYTLATRDRIEP